MTLADRIVVKREGRIEQAGSPMELYRDSVNRFVAGFLDSPTMNLIDAGLLGICNAHVAGPLPQYLKLARSGHIKGKDLHVERLGSDTHVIVEIGNGATSVALLTG